jgi:hypothetical protein
MVMFVRRLRPGVSFEEFKQAWLAEPNHFGQPVVVTHGQRLDDDREIVSYALLDTTVEQLTDMLSQPSVLQGESERHDRIEHVLETTVIKGFYEIRPDATDLTLAAWQVANLCGQRPRW